MRARWGAVVGIASATLTITSIEAASIEATIGVASEILLATGNEGTSLDLAVETSISAAFSYDTMRLVAVVGLDPADKVQVFFDFDGGDGTQNAPIGNPVDLPSNLFPLQLVSMAGVVLATVILEQ